MKKSIFLFHQTFKIFFSFKPISFLNKFSWFFKNLYLFKMQKSNNNFKLSYIYPCLLDNTSSHQIEPTYFFQDSWASGHIFRDKPDKHFDIGSNAMTIGILSQFTPVTMIDIRPIDLKLPNLSFIKGSILDLPFEDNSISSVSSLCVIEHIGLGRYGDPLDPFGSEKAIQEIKRVTKSNGTVLFTVPVDNENKIFFNAHRAFTRDYIIQFFDGFILEDEKYHYGRKMYESYDALKGFGTGFFKFKKL
jgi:hypothetical protein